MGINGTLAEIYGDIRRIEDRDISDKIKDIIDNYICKENGCSEAVKEIVGNLDNIYDTHKLYKEALKQAIEGDMITVVYQPIVDMDKEIVAVEALARWVDHKGDMLSPIYFIPFAIEHEMIEDISKVVIQKALHHIGEINKKGKRIRVSINISGKQIDDCVVHGNLQRYLDIYGVDKRDIIVEITEDEKFNCENMQRIHDMGIDVCIDDFGTDYSNLNRIRGTQAKGIKIDKYFIDNINDPKTKGIIKHTIKMIHELEMYVVAEGVETEEQFEILKELKCDYVQGYLISRPVNIERIKEQLV